MSPIIGAWAVAIAVVTWILLASIVQAMQRRGFDPVGTIARVLSPDVTEPEADA